MKRLALIAVVTVAGALSSGASAGPVTCGPVCSPHPPPPPCSGPICTP